MTQANREPEGREPIVQSVNPKSWRAEVIEFLLDLRDPERYGHAVTQEVRQRARDLSRRALTEEGIPALLEKTFTGE